MEDNFENFIFILSLLDLKIDASILKKFQKFRNVHLMMLSGSHNQLNSILCSECRIDSFQLNKRLGNHLIVRCRGIGCNTLVWLAYLVENENVNITPSLKQIL